MRARTVAPRLTPIAPVARICVIYAIYAIYVGMDWCRLARAVLHCTAMKLLAHVLSLRLLSPDGWGPP